MTARAIQDECEYCPNPARVAAYSGAIAVHVLAFAFLLLPITYEHMPTLAKKPDDRVVGRFVPTEATPPPPPPTPAPPPRPTAHPTAAHPTSPPVPTTVPYPIQPTVAPSDTPTVDRPDFSSSVIAPTTTGPAITVDVRYRKHPIVFEPRLLRAGMSGTVLLRILIDREGKPAKIELEKSSGFPALDASARAQVRAWAFVPAVVDGQEVEVTAIIPVRFSIDRG